MLEPYYITTLHNFQAAAAAPATGNAKRIIKTLLQVMFRAHHSHHQDEHGTPSSRSHTQAFPPAAPRHTIQ